MPDKTSFGADVAETTVAYGDFDLNPAYHDGKSDEPPQVWPESQYLRELVERHPPKPAATDRELLKQAAFRQLRSLALYRAVGDLIAVGTPAKKKPPPQNLLTLYVLLFPGEGKDNTGIKDLNDKVFGYAYTSEFVKVRNNAIKDIFKTTGFGPGYDTFGQDYKTSSILARGKTPEDFAKDLVVLDEKLRTELLAILERALNDPELTEAQKTECRKLKRALKSKKYRFDYLFGSRSKVVHGDQLDNTFLLITEALKGAGIARFGVKRGRLQTKDAKRMGDGRVPRTPRKQDDRGQPYLDSASAYLRVSAAGPAIKQYILDSGSSGQGYFLRRVFVDTVWTDAYLLYRLLYFGNPDMIRDVRKKALVQAKVGQSVQYNFRAQKELLELWLVALNVVDFVSGFLKSEYAHELLRCHRTASNAIDELTGGSDVTWDRLTRSSPATCGRRSRSPSSARRRSSSSTLTRPTTRSRSSSRWTSATSAST